MITRQQMLGSIGATIVATSIFLPALSFPYLTVSLWEAHRWTAAFLLGTAGVVLFLTGAGAYRRLIPTATVAAVIGAGQLILIIGQANIDLAENARLAVREPGWAGLFANGIPRVNWWGWIVLAAGIVVILFAGLPNKAVNPSGESGVSK